MSRKSAIRRGFGYRPDPTDTRDKRLAELKLKKALPKAASLRSHVAIVLDQGATSSCVAHAWAQALRIGDVLDGRANAELSSRLFLYYNARAYHDDETRDEGTYLRTCAKGILHFGRSAEVDWPFNTRKINVRPPWKAYRAAFDLSGPRGYYRIDSGDLDGVRLAVASGKPVVFGMVVGTEFLSDDGPVLIDRMDGQGVAGHAMCVVGYEGDTFEIVNSWGASWRDGGFARLTSARLSKATDLWVVDP